MIGSHLFDFFVPTIQAFADVSAGGSGKLIAVAALSLDESSEISTYASHAPNFLLFDDTGRLREIIPNPYVNLHEETGEKVADLLERHSVGLMIAVSAHRRDLP